MADKSSLTFSFCGEYEVDALSLSVTINSLVEIASFVAEKEFPETEFRLSIKAVAPGSLEFDFVAAAVPVAQTLLTSGAMEYAANLIEVIKAAFSIKKFLKGLLPQNIDKSADELVITNTDGSQIKLPARAGVFFIGDQIDNSITNIFQAASLSPGVSGVKVAANGEVEICRDEFEACATKTEMTANFDSQNSITSLRKNETLFIRQPDFSGDLKWRFKSDLNFSASMDDVVFQTKVKSGEIVLSAKSYIIADVQVTTYLGPDGLPDESKPTYRIPKVHSIQTVEEGQTKLDT